MACSSVQHGDTPCFIVQVPKNHNFGMRCARGWESNPDNTLTMDRFVKWCANKGLILTCKKVYCVLVCLSACLPTQRPSLPAQPEGRDGKGGNGSRWDEPCHCPFPPSLDRPQTSQFGLSYRKRMRMRITMESQWRKRNWIKIPQCCSLRVCTPVSYHIHVHSYVCTEYYLSAIDTDASSMSPNSPKLIGYVLYVRCTTWDFS